MDLESDAVKAKIDSCRIGRNCQSRFWCGFCNKLIDLRKRGVDAWTERFDHIDDHFMGRHSLLKQSIKDWVPMDSNMSKGEVGGISEGYASPDEDQGMSATPSAAVSPISRPSRHSSPSSVNRASLSLPGKYANAKYPKSTLDIKAAISTLESNKAKLWQPKDAMTSGKVKAESLGYEDWPEPLLGAQEYGTHKHTPRLARSPSIVNQESSSGTPRSEKRTQLDADLESAVPIEHTKGTAANSSLSKL
jgi:hypothetical protein